MMKRALILATLLFSWGCGETCTTDEHACSGDVLEVCVDEVWEVEEDCAESDMICHDMGADSHCMSDGDMEM